MDKRQTFMELFPNEMKCLFQGCLQHLTQLSEIRFRVAQPICVYMNGNELFLTKNGDFTTHVTGAKRITITEIEHFFAHICEFSPYAFLKELGNGYITTKGGHRIGVVGEMIKDENGCYRMKQIAFMNIRIAHEVPGVAKPILGYLFENKQFQSTMIVSPPGVGKTTLLRDIIRNISDGYGEYRGLNVSVVDERSEIAGCYLGIPQNAVGMRTDVLDGCEKRRGILLLLRSMAPQVIAADEVSGEDELFALTKAAHCGCRFLLTMHAEDYASFSDTSILKRLRSTNMIQRMIILSIKEGKRWFEIRSMKGDIVCSNWLDAQ